MNYKNCVFYDMGHGGIDRNGVYTTAPSKMFDHKNGVFHQGSIFYEGVKNRTYGNEIVKLLRNKGVNVIVVNHEFNDTPLQVRTDIANMYHTNIQRGLYISEHSNATQIPNTARGISVWTSPGQTRSDVYAQWYIDMMKSDTMNIPKGTRVMEDLSDKDGDYEARFHVLTVTSMPAILIENLFFDNIQDARLLMNNDYFKWYTELQAEWIIRCIQDLDKIV